MDVVKLTAIAGQQNSEDLSPPLSGLVYKVRLVLSNNPGSNTDVTLSCADDPPGETIVQRNDLASNLILYPRRPVQDAAGNPLTLEGTRPLTEPYVVHGRLKLTIQQANLGGQCTAWVWLNRL